MVERQTRHPFPEKLRGLVRVIKDRVTKESRRSHLILSDSAKKTIRDWVLKPNPRQSEVCFIGVGTDNIVDTVYAPEGDFSPNSGMFLGGFSGARTDTEESRLLWERVNRDERLDEVSFFGHLHPSGEMSIMHKGVSARLISNPREGLLWPSSGDLDAVRFSVNENPQTNILYEAIAANTQNGPCLRIYLISELLRVKKNGHIWSVPHQTIQLA